MGTRRKNYVLGHGERLVEDIESVAGGGQKNHPYSFDEAKERLAPRILRAAKAVDELPPGACPRDEAVVAVTLHPSYLAKSYYPSDLFRAVGVYPLGSKERQVRPEKALSSTRRIASPDGYVPTAEIFIAGPRVNFRKWAREVISWTDHPDYSQLMRLEDVRYVSPAERLKGIPAGEASLLEVVLHSEEAFVIDGLRRYLEEMGVLLALDERIRASGLCFIPVRIPETLHIKLAEYSFLRLARKMPRLRDLGCLQRGSGVNFEVSLPDGGPLWPEVKVAVFDGGIPANSELERWVTPRDAPGVGPADYQQLEHGYMVTSALLFGPLQKNTAPAVPYCAVDHYRVLDQAETKDPEGNYYPVIRRIMSILEEKTYDFINLSIGPDLPIDDDDIHVWTALLDKYLADGKTLAAVAVGNGGEADVSSGNARVQTPADGVNVLAVGSSDRMDDNWSRASYSCRGPGRSPGLVKPDILAFGGSESQPFYVLCPDSPGRVVPVLGTSFAAPNGLRSGIGVRGALGTRLTPLGVKALLIHHGRGCRDSYDRHEVGWGNIPIDLENLFICESGVVHVLYQGSLAAGKYVRMPIPVPTRFSKGRVSITATFCFASETDPTDPVHYTRAGLEIKFRPHRERFTPGNDGRTPKHPDAKPFFKPRELYNTEQELRRNAQQWETCLKQTKRMKGESLLDPMFDVHYIARKRGRGFVDAPAVPYALVTSVAVPDHPEIYDEVLVRYRNVLEPLRPLLEIPIRGEVTS